MPTQENAAIERVAIVTGGGSGIGAATCRMLSNDHIVVVVDRDEGNAEDTANSINSSSALGAAVAMTCDVSNSDQVDQTVAQVSEKFGRLDVVVNAAGITRRLNLIDTTDLDWHSVLDVNLMGTFNVCRATADLLTRGGRKDCDGRIINVASGSGVVGWAYPAYTASKGGVIALTRQLAAELSPQGVTVNTVSPGFVLTPINEASLLDIETTQKILRKIPVGRIGSTEDVAALIGFLASAQSGFINGVNIPVDGGMLATMRLE